MRGLSLTQPWASLIAIGAKRIETRSWATSYRGTLAIHASKGFPVECRELCEEWPFDDALASAGVTSWQRLPRGMIVATCELVACVSTSGSGARLELWPGHPLNEWERAFGDYSAGRFAWILANVVSLPEPIPVTGSLGLWPVEVDVERQIRQQGGG